jgi:hypothetical protein
MVFLCYAREDKALVDRIYLELYQAGLRPWMDKPPTPYHQLGIPPGSDWDAYIRKKIGDADTFLAFFSQRSVLKRGYVQREYRLALDVMNQLPADQTYLLPVLLEACEIPDLRGGTASLRSIQQFEWYEHGTGGLVSAIAGHWGVDLAEQSWVDELSHARAVQEDLFGQVSIIPGYEVASAWRPLTELGGDFVDVFRIDDTAYGLLLGDATTKGTRAAIIGSVVYGAVRGLLAAGTPLERCMATANSLLCEKNAAANLLTTCFVGRLDTKYHRLTYVSAGAGPAYHVLVGDSFAMLDSTAHPLGILEHVPFESRVVGIANGDMILVATDGVMEVVGESDTEYFGRPERLIAAVRSGIQKHPHEFATKVLAAIDAFGQQQDDQALLMVRRLSQ